MTRLVGDQLEQHQAKFTGLEHPPAPAPAPAPTLGAIAEVEMKWSPIALPAAPAARREQAFGNVEFEPPARSATMMSVGHVTLLMMCLRYILAASQTRLGVQFFPRPLWSRGNG